MSILKILCKSKKKLHVPKDQWAVTENTHTPIVSQEQFELAQINLGKGSLDFRQYDQVRRSIFSGIAFCAKCGHALCSCGTVYKGEREKYWYLSCIKQRQDIANPALPAKRQQTLSKKPTIQASSVSWATRPWTKAGHLTSRRNTKSLTSLSERHEGHASWHQQRFLPNSISPQ